MTNAWIQRFLTVALLLVSWVGAVHLWPDNKVVAVWMASLPILITPLVLIQSFSMAAWANRRDSTPYASLAQWLCAWLAETKASLTIMHVWQPFRHQAIANHTLAKPADVAPQRGMVLVHGFFCNRAFWTDWMRQLRAEGRVFVSVDLEPAYGSITDYADTVERAIAQVEQATGLPPVVVGHSMGGLAIRAWAARHERRSETMRRVHHIFTLGTPHQGTGLATMSVSTNGLQMRQNSTWLANNAAQLPANFAERCTCFYSNCDNIVFPASTACFQGADNQLIEGVGHVELAFIPGVRQTCWRALA